MTEKKEIAESWMGKRKMEATPLFESVIMSAFNDKNWLVMELVARSYNETDSEVWASNTFSSFLGVTEHWVSKIAKEKGLTVVDVCDLQRDLMWYEKLHHDSKK